MRPEETLHHAGKLADNLPSLLLQAEKVAHTFMKGVHGRRRVGMGETFWQFRHYQPGDARRDIDWRQTAKRDTTYIRQMEWEAAQTLWLYRDASESMNYKSAGSLLTKRAYAEVLLLALSMLALSGGEQVGLLGTGLAPLSHYNAVERIHAHLPEQKALTEGARPVSARSHAVLLSDFYFPAEETAAFVGGLAQRGVGGIVAQVYDPSETALPFKGRTRFVNMEQAGADITIPQAEAVAQAYAEKFRAHQAALAQGAQAAGWKFVTFPTDAPPEKALASLFDMLAVV